MKQEERSSRPRQMIHDAQEHAYRWHDMAMRAHQGVAETDTEVIRRMYHTAVMNYWKQLERHSRNGHVGQFWQTKQVIPADGDDLTLSDLGELRFRTQQASAGGFDADAGQMSGATRKPVALTIRQATAALEALDRVANELSFDAAAKEERDRFGFVEADDGEGVEVSTDAVS